MYSRCVTLIKKHIVSLWFLCQRLKLWLNMIGCRMALIDNHDNQQVVIAAILFNTTRFLAISSVRAVRNHCFNPTTRIPNSSVCPRPSQKFVCNGSRELVCTLFEKCEETARCSVHAAWVTWPEHPKGVKDVKQAPRAAT